MRTLSMTPDAIRMRANYAKKKAVAAKTELPDITEPTEDVPQIEVAQPTPKPKLSLVDRLTGAGGAGQEAKVRQPSSDRRKRTKKIDSNLLRQLAPTLIATFAATYSRQLIKDPYKMCAPSQEEVLTIVAPFFNILSRYVEITGHASETTLDLINAALASIMYGTRYYITFVMIKEGIHEKPNELDTAPTSRTEGEDRAAIRNTAEDTGLVHYSSSQDTDAQNGYSNALNGHSLNDRSEAARVAELLQRDYEGRRQLGLVP